jgi:hypothetical protein
MILWGQKAQQPAQVYLILSHAQSDRNLGDLEYTLSASLWDFGCNEDTIDPCDLTMF